MKYPDGFHFAQMDDFEKISDFTRPMGGELSCEYAFANLLSWGELYQLVFKVQGKHLWIYNGTEDYLYFPLGDVVTPALLVEKSKVLQIAGFSGIIDQVPKSWAETHKKELEKTFSYVIDDRFLDYVYSADTLAELQGESLSKKRNLCHQFERLYPTWKETPLHGNEGLPTWLEPFIQKWATAAAKDGGSIEEDIQALQQVFNCWDSGGHEGLVLWVENEVVAFTIWSRPTLEMSITHFEKALRNYKGASQMINRQCARFVRDQCHIKWINREQDLGVEGLRQAKRSYMPAYQIEVGFLRPKTD